MAAAPPAFVTTTSRGPVARPDKSKTAVRTSPPAAATTDVAATSGPAALKRDDCSVRELAAENREGDNPSIAAARRTNISHAETASILDRADVATLTLGPSPAAFIECRTPAVSRPAARGCPASMAKLSGSTRR